LIRYYAVKKLLVLLFIFFAGIFSVKASHIVGGEMYYDYLGNNQYRIYIAIYRDCASTGAAYDAPLSLGVFKTSDNSRVTDISVPFPGSVNLPVIFNNPCVTPPANICTERAIYTTIVTLPPIAGGYTLAYQRCCRGPNVTNLTNPDDTGLTLVSYIPGPSAYINSSARFTNYPPLVICNNENLNFDHSATDPDGDALTYELVTPNAGANSVNPMPVPIPNPPYNPVVWAPGITAPAPLGPGSITTINPNTGALFVDANLLGLYVVGIRVNEWRNGVIINSTTRDFLFRVVNCVVALSAEINTQENSPGFAGYCNGLSFTFDNLSWGATSYLWDFGVTGTSTDVSSAFEPTYTFPAPGTYPVMLVANPGWPCTDTATINVTVNNPLVLDFTFPDSICFPNNSVDFTAQGTASPGTLITWNFGPNATPQTASTPNVNNVNFNTIANNSITLTGINGTCTDTVTHPIFLVTQPTAAFNMQPNYECDGFTQVFTNTSQNSPLYFWNFGVPNTTSDFSISAQPTFTFPAPGNYTVTLVAIATPTCTDSTQLTITINEPLSLAFTHNDSLCIIGNSFDFDATVSGPPFATYSWNFGTSATPNTSSQIDVNNVTYTQPGNHTIQLSGSFLNCVETVSSSIFIYDTIKVDFNVPPGPFCAPSTVVFANASTADVPLVYYWEFGNGNTSTLANPINTYLYPGTYDVSLQIAATEGCTDTISMLQANAVTIHPQPQAKFSIDISETDICNALITFTDESQGAISLYYDFDDNGQFSNDTNPVYQFQTAGTHNPIQIATNEFGCKDTARRSIDIQPFTVFIPNTFTPDGNEFNNVFQAIVALDPLTWKLELFNRWGELFFETTDKNDTWDGTYKGKPAKEGTYTYKVTYVPCGVIQEEQIITGHVNILR
jgi:gliding motility-associated-like protein